MLNVRRGLSAVACCSCFFNYSFDSEPSLVPATVVWWAKVHVSPKIADAVGLYMVHQICCPFLPAVRLYCRP